jgi:HTH-type transcriptional regulator, competence development regulator
MFCRRTGGVAMRLAEYLRQQREEHGWSLRELAEKSGLSNGYLSLLENGRVESPSATVLGKLAKAFPVPLDDLLRSAGVEIAAPSTGDVDPQLVSALRRLDTDARQQLLSYAKYLAEQPRGRRRSR